MPDGSKRRAAPAGVPCWPRAGRGETGRASGETVSALRVNLPTRPPLSAPGGGVRALAPRGPRPERRHACVGARAAERPRSASCLPLRCTFARSPRLAALAALLALLVALCQLRLLPADCSLHGCLTLKCFHRRAAPRSLAFLA